MKSIGINDLLMQVAAAARNPTDPPGAVDP